MELNISNPPNLHSPLSLVYIEDTRMAPCTEEASALMNLSVDYPNNTLDLDFRRVWAAQLTATVYRPHFAVSSVILLRFTAQERGVTLSVTI